MKDKNIRKKVESANKLAALSMLIVLLMTATPILQLAGACGPHIETPRSAVINEIQSGNNPWVELVNPTSEDINIRDWEIQKMKDGEWRTVHRVNTDIIEKWGSGKEYVVLSLEDELDDENVDIRIIDYEGNEIDRTSYSSLDSEHTWARYKQQTGIPVDRDLLDDWFVSSIITKGYENDSAIS